VSWGGGSRGSIDHIMVGLIAKDVGVDPTKVNYVAFAGGGEAKSAILGGHVTVGVAGVSEFAADVDADACAPWGSPRASSCAICPRSRSRA
jgi:tripartite-type tricarboxylate transporter receptor subunit TctC